METFKWVVVLLMLTANILIVLYFGNLIIEAVDDNAAQIATACGYVFGSE